MENNVCYNNGLQDNPNGRYLLAAFAADASGVYTGTSYTIRNNTFYKTFPEQYLNYYFQNDQVDDFS